MRPHRKSLASSGAILIIFSLLEQILHLVNRSVYAGIFGATQALDVLLLVTSFVTWFDTIFILSTRQSLIPNFIEVREKHGEEAAWKLGSTIVNSLTVVSLLIVFISVLFSPHVARLLGAGLDLEAQRLMVELLRIVAFTTAFRAISALMMALLFSYESFTVPHTLRVVGLIAVLSINLLVSPYIGIYGMAIAILVDSIILMLGTTFWVWHKGYGYNPLYLNFRDSHLLNFAKVTGPLLIFTMLSKSEQLVDRFFASFLIAGAVSYLNFGLAVARLPHTILTTANQALLPRLSTMATHQRREKLSDLVYQSMLLQSFLTIPAYIGLLILGREIIVVLFQHGDFTSVQTAGVWSVVPWFFGYLLVGTSSTSLSLLLRAYQRTGAIMLVGIFQVVSNVILNAIFMFSFSYPGIALSTSVTLVLQMLLLLYFVRDLLSAPNWMFIFSSLISIIISCIIMSLVLVFLKSTPLQVIETGYFEISNIPRLIVFIGVGATVYSLTALLLSNPQSTFYRAYLLRMVKSINRKVN